MIKAIFIDIDGTLSTKTIDTIKKLVKKVY